MRIVSLCPSSTELVFALGGGPSSPAIRLVGVTKFCIHPKEQVDRIEKVGGTKNPDVERIVGLRPDLVLLNEEENRIEDAKQLEEEGVRCLTTFPKTVLETAESIRVTGEALGAVEPAEALARSIEERRAELRRVGHGRRRFAYLIWRKPYMTVNADTYVHDLLACAGGENVFGNESIRYPEVSTEALARTDPDVVLLSSEPFPFADKHADELHAETGLPRERFRLVDGEYLSWHGPRTLPGLSYAAEVLAPASTEPSGPPADG